MAAVRLPWRGFAWLLAATHNPWIEMPAAIAVEYELDAPLDMKQKWSFVRDESFFIQHQCGEEGGKSAAQKIRKLLNKESPLKAILTPMRHLQVRLLAGLGAYRRTFRFSKERHAHYDEKLDLITSYCGVSGAILEEHIILHRLAEAPLRVWQKIFIAEMLPYLDTSGKFLPFYDAAKITAKPLRYVLLSNHRPEKPERATLRQLAAFLQKEQKTREFLTALLNWRGFDDTGTEILENMFSTGIQKLEERITPAETEKNPNNTLPGRK